MCKNRGKKRGVLGGEGEKVHFFEKKLGKCLVRKK